MLGHQRLHDRLRTLWIQGNAKSNPDQWNRQTERLKMVHRRGGQLGQVVRQLLESEFQRIPQSCMA